jgi:hypothetical protein
VRITFMNFSGVTLCPSGKIIDHSDKIFWYVEGDGTASALM